MNIFKSKGIILSIKRKESECDIYTFFSYEFGKILVQKKKKSRERALDIGYIINCEIETGEKKTLHRIKNIKIKYEFSPEGKSFSTIFDFLGLIALIKKLSPDGIPIPEVYKLCSELYKLKEITETKILLAKLKVLDIFGILGQEHTNPTVIKIIKFVRENSIETIYKLKEIDQDLRENLKKLLHF